MAYLRKDESGLKAPTPEHPLFTGSTSVGMISGENPRYPARQVGHEVLGEALKQLGLKSQTKEGMYGTPEKSHMVFGATREQMFKLGQHFGQDSVVYSQGGKHELLYTNGHNAGRYHPSLDHEFFKEAPTDYYTHMPEMGGYLRLNFDFDTLEQAKLDQEHSVEALNSRSSVKAPLSKAEIQKAIAQSLRKGLGAMTLAHPHAYQWHDPSTDHHFHVASPGVVLRSKVLRKDEPQVVGAEPTPKPPKNEQAAGVGAKDYAKFAMPYGTVDKSNPTDLVHYPYHGKSAEVKQLVKDHGYSVYYAGGKHGRPDLAARNYTTKHLMIYDPSSGSGGDFGHEEYTDAWRQTHELAHALTHEELNKTYGEGRRIGKIGTHRSLNEALRAVHWEHLAAHKQRELSKQIGVEIPDDVFAKEYNSVMHDAVHRAVTGKFTEPSAEGFRPHSHPVPLETALGMVREHARSLGLTGMHDLIKKSETVSIFGLLKQPEGTNTMAEKTFTTSDIRKACVDLVRAKVASYEKDILALRQRELKKAEEAPPSKASMNPMDCCPMCGEEDIPGKCMCLQGPAAGMAKSDMGDPKENHKPPMMAKSELCKGCGKEHEMKKCGLDEIKPGKEMKKEEKKATKAPHHYVECPKCESNFKVSKEVAAAPAHKCWAEEKEKAVKKTEIVTKAKEPVKTQEGSGGKITKLAKAAMGKEAKSQSMVDSAKASLSAPKAAAPAVKLPGAKDQAARASTFSDFTPPGKFSAPSAPAPSLPGRSAAPKAAAAPTAGTAGLTPPKAAPAPSAPKAMGAGMAPGAKAPIGAAPPTKPANPVMGALKAAGGAVKSAFGKSETSSSDLRKPLGNCALCNKSEHLGSC